MATSRPIPTALAPRGPGRRLVSLREDVRVEYTDPSRSDCPLLARTPWGTVGLGPQDTAGRTALWRMSLGPVDPANLEGKEPAPPALVLLFDRLADVIVHSLAPADGTSPLLSVVPLLPGARFRPVVPAHRAVVHLVHDTTAIRSLGSHVLVAPDGSFRVELHRPPATLLPAALSAPLSVAGLVRALDGHDAGLVTEVVGHLLGAGAAVETSGDRAV